jgi:hypothetical protein
MHGTKGTREREPFFFVREPKNKNKKGSSVRELPKKNQEKTIPKIQGSLHQHRMEPTKWPITIG